MIYTMHAGLVMFHKKKEKYFTLDIDKMLDKISRYSKIDDIYTKIGLLCSKIGNEGVSCICLPIDMKWEAECSITGWNTTRHLEI